jgi:hypothetical protein
MASNRAKPTTVASLNPAAEAAPLTAHLQRSFFPE